MGSGLVYAAVGLVWAWYAASRVAGARAERRADRESSAQARVIRRAAAADHSGGAGGSGPAPVDAPTGARPAGDTPAGVSPPAARPVPRSARRAAVRRRRTVLSLLVLASLGLGASAALGYLPIWAAAPAPLLCLAHLVAGARVSRRSAGRPVTTVRTPAPATTDDPSWAGVPFVDVVADWCRTVPGDVHHTEEVEAHVGPAVPAGAHLDADRVEAARLRSASTPAVPDTASTAGSWRAVPVPLPTYVTAPRVARTVKTIDLGSTGAWTSGRTVAAPLSLPVAGTDPSTGAAQVGVGAVEPVTADADAVATGTTTGPERHADEDTEAIALPHAASA